MESADRQAYARRLDQREGGGGTVGQAVLAQVAPEAGRARPTPTEKALGLRHRAWMGGRAGIESESDTPGPSVTGL